MLISRFEVKQIAEKRTVTSTLPARKQQDVLIHTSAMMTERHKPEKNESFLSLFWPYVHPTRVE